MARLDPAKLHARCAPGIVNRLVIPRCYTLTHSDVTGELFLTVAPEVEQEQIAGLYTRLMRDEVVAEWRENEGGTALHVYCHVSGGLVLGGAAMRDAIFRRELPLVLEAFRAGDDGLYRAQPELDDAPIVVHFRSANPRYQITECWGTPAACRV